MSRSEFRYNKKRKHYAYLFKDIGTYRRNLILTSKATRFEHHKAKKNVKLQKHPNPKTNKVAYVIPIIYADNIDSFDIKILEWKFDKNDKRKIKRLKKRHKL